MVAAVGQPHQFYKLLTLLVRPDNPHNLAPHSMYACIQQCLRPSLYIFFGAGCL